MSGKKSKSLRQKRASRRGAGPRGRQSEALIWRNPGGAPMPPRYYTTITTSLYGVVNTSVASGKYYVAINEPGLPWVGGGWPNTQPTPINTLSCAGFDQLCNVRFYQNYRCFQSRIKLEFCPIAINDVIEVTITPSVSTSTPSSVASAQMQPYTKRGLFSSNKNNSNSRRGASAMTHSMAVHTLLGVRKSAVEDDLSGRLVGNFNTAPTGQFYYVVNWAHIDGSTVADELMFRVEVSYDVEFSNFSSGDLLFS